MSEMTNGVTEHHETVAKPIVEAKPRKPTKKPKKIAKKRASAASSKPASAPKKKRVQSRGKSKKTPGHWSKTHAQLVLHATPELVAKLDRKLSSLGKTLKLERPTRGSVLRALVEKAVK